MFENPVKALPLEGKRILVTRTSEQAGTFSERLRSLGALPVEFPTIRIVPPLDWGPLDDALKLLYGSLQEDGVEKGSEQKAPIGIDDSASTSELKSVHVGYDWLVFTSVNGVHIFFQRLHDLGYDASALQSVRIATIGPATAQALELYGVAASLVPDEYIAEGIGKALIEDAQRRGVSLKGMRILLARAAEARNVLVTMLEEAGVVVNEVAAYRTLPISGDDKQGQEVLSLLRSQRLDLLTFTSSSTVRNFMLWLRECKEKIPGFSVEKVIHDFHFKVACIGPITSRTARELGLNVSIEAKTFTIEGLIEAIIQDEEKQW